MRSARESLREEKALTAAERCLRGLILYTRGKSPSYDIRVKLYIDKATIKRNRNSPRAMACASFDGKTPKIGVCTNVAQLPPEFLCGVLVHELTHLAYNLVGDRHSEVDTDSTILLVMPEVRYGYEDCEYEDAVTGKARIARNLQRVNEGFAGSCMKWLADRCEEGRVNIQWTRTR
jgi:hypothetical protein